MSGEPKTRRGRESRDRIVEHAAALIAEHGVDGMSLEEVMAAAGVSKSQLYHYFADRDELVTAAIASRCEQVLGELTQALGGTTTLAELEARLGGFVAAYETQLSGCPIGTLAAQVAEHDLDTARSHVVVAFDRWEELFAAAFERMRNSGELRPDASPQALATALLAGIEGGLLLSQARRSGESLRVAVDGALRGVRSFLA